MIKATLSNGKNYCHVTRPNRGASFSGPLLFNFVPYRKGYKGAGRVGNMSLSDQVHIYDLDSSLKVTSSRQGTKGEDPRVFLYKNHPYAFIVDPHPDEQGQHVFSYKILDLVTVETKVLSIDKVPETPLGRLGKNWIPYVKDDELYFIVTIDPELSILKCDLETGFCSWETEYKEELLITISRGGTPMVYLEEAESFVGFGHRTYDCHNHKPFLYSINKEGKVFVDSEDIEVPSERGIYDPLSLYWEDSKLYCCITSLPVQAGDTGEGWAELFEVIFDEL